MTAVWLLGFLVSVLAGPRCGRCRRTIRNPLTRVQSTGDWHARCYLTAWKEARYC